MLNAKGSSPSEILGTTYKTVLKAALSALANETKRIFASKHDESNDLQKHLQGNAKIIEEKRNHVSVLEAKTNEVSPSYTKCHNIKINKNLKSVFPFVCSC